MLILFRILIISIFLSSCSRGISNDDIIKEVKKCKEAGLKPILLYDGWTSNPIRVMCEPKEEI